VALLVLADGFRRSFGASENGPLVAVVPLTVIIVLFAALLLPGQRVLLHAAAAMAVVLAAGSVWILRETVFMGAIGLLYSGLWLAWYWHTAWARAAAPSS
jgi:cytochrome c-type biogenesis protein CcmH/NrfG